MSSSLQCGYCGFCQNSSVYLPLLNCLALFKSSLACSLSLLSPSLLHCSSKFVKKSVTACLEVPSSSSLSVSQSLSVCLSSLKCGHCCWCLPFTSVNFPLHKQSQVALRTPQSSFYFLNCFALCKSDLLFVHCPSFFSQGLLPCCSKFLEQTQSLPVSV